MEMTCDGEAPKFWFLVSPPFWNGAAVYHVLSELQERRHKGIQTASRVELGKVLCTRVCRSRSS